MAKPDSALSTTKRRHLQWEAMLAIVLAVSLAGGRVLSPMFLSSANLSNMLADFTEIALIALPMTSSSPPR
jgi:rhamnose transport system permease protein